MPWLPVSNLIAEHVANLAKADVNGLMLSWSLGGYPSPNLEIAQAFAQKPDASIETILSELANRRYGLHATPHALDAWAAFSNAFREFPYNIATVYTAPLQYGPANLLYAEPTGYKATMVGFAYDDLTAWRGIYPADIFIQQLQKLVVGWQKGLSDFDEVIANTTNEQKITAKQDGGIAKAAWIHFASVANQAMFVQCRDSLLQTGKDQVSSNALRKKIMQILANEKELASSLFEITRHDSRIGFEASNQYYYVVQDLVEKVLNCNYLMDYYKNKR
ncbi:MAG: hypothetical protein QM802_14205 [Agriterribacter sp.]